MQRLNPCDVSVAILALAILSVLTPGCHSVKSAFDLDDIARSVDEYGTATVTEPLLLKDVGQFDMKVNRPTTDYIDAARTGVQGASRDAIMEAFTEDAVLGVTATVVPANPINGVQSNPLTFTQKLPTSKPSEALLPGFTPVPKLETQPSTLTERQLLTVGVNDKATEVLLQNLFHPANFDPEKQVVYIGILQVGCQPGWRTRNGYVADVNVSVRYANSKAATTRQLEQLGVVGTTNDRLISSLVGGQEQPTVLSVFPSLEAQTLDLQSDARSRIALALRIAALLRFGPADVQAKSLTNYAKQLESDSNTRSLIPVITSYSNGSSFGYQIRPAFQALDDPAASQAKPADVLGPCSFPAVVLLVCDKAAVVPDGNKVAPFDRIAFSVSSRWIPVDEEHSLHRLSEIDRDILLRA